MATSKKKIEDQENPFASLEAKYGKHSVIPANSKGYEKIKESTSTGSLTLDLSTGIMGIPKNGKITQIIGDTSQSNSQLLNQVFPLGKCGQLRPILCVEQ